MNPGRTTRLDLMWKGRTMIAKYSAVGGAVAAKGALILGAMIGLSALAPANAADLGGARGGSLKDDGMPVLMAQSAARFYVRVDGSYASYDAPVITEDHQFDLLSPKMGNNWSVGGGVGYYINRNWRTDFTAEKRFNSDVSATNGDPNIGGSRHFAINSELYLANLYYDFDSRGRFTPYVGAGLGWVNHHTTTGSVTDNCGCTGVIDAGGGSSVAAALMTGVTVNLTGRGAPAGSGEGSGDAARNLYLDVGYRFLYLGEASTGAIHTTPVAPSVASYNPADPTVSEIHAHEFRVGLRYDFR